MTTYLRGRQELAAQAADEADALRFTIRHPEQRGAWDRACGLIHRDPQLAATTLLALAAMVPADADTAELLARIDELHAPAPRRG
ncbi:hypothetical protein GCM10023201_41260 [Actinomycetospora corticicola]|uniref:Uncharacterized protein n=1 Tax=Actinomycetospora corticicola TaxID=663602 RepID=A0A7Y9J618_9PSEU|nr:hypothetical protein [Actinomycetospora corticicola]NYD36787.1 hypothetical protein [Actinomycetospora corticicola]